MKMMWLVVLVVAGLFTTVTATIAAENDPVRLEVHFLTANSSDPVAGQLESTMTVPGTEVDLTTVFGGEFRRGFTSQGAPSLYVDVVVEKGETILALSKAVDGNVYWKPLDTAWTSFKQSERVVAATEIVIASGQIDSGCKIVLFLPPSISEPEEPQVYDIPTMDEILKDEPVPCAIKEGPWFILEWMGGSDWVHPDYALRWRAYRDYAGAFLVLHWEMHGTETLEIRQDDIVEHDSLVADGSAQPTVFLGQFEEDTEEQCRTIPPLRGLAAERGITIDPSGGVEFYMANDDMVSYFPSRCTPGLEIRGGDNPTLQRAWIRRTQDGWRWCPAPLDK